MNGTEVLLIGDYPPPTGGIATHVYRLREHLIGRGFSVEVLDIGKGKNVELGVRGVTPIEALAEILKRGTEKKIIHLHTSGNNRNSWLLTGLFSLVQNASKKMVTFHSGLLPNFLGTHRRLTQSVLKLSHLIDLFVCVSAEQERALHATGLMRASTAVVTPFIPLEENDSFFQTPATQGRSPILSVMYHPSPVYGFSTVREAISEIGKRYPNVLCVFFGAIPDSPSLGAQGLFVGELEQKEVAALMKLSDVFVRPTTTDGDSMSVREALSLGVRTVASDAVVRPQGAVLFRTGDANDLVRAIDDALKQPPPRVPSVHGGDEIVKLYQELIAR